MKYDHSVATMMMAALGYALLLAACPQADGDSSASEGNPESETAPTGSSGASPTTGGATDSPPGGTTGTGGPDAPGDTTGTGGPDAPVDTTQDSTGSTTGTGDPTGTSSTGEPVDTMEGSSSSTTGDEETEGGTCDDLAALQALSLQKGGQAQCPGWTGIMTFSGPCPEPGQGWHAEKVFPGAEGEFGKYCYYQWVSDQDSEWDLCGLPPDGVRSPAQWLGPDCNF